MEKRRFNALIHSDHEDTRPTLRKKELRIQHEHIDPVAKLRQSLNC